MLEFRKTICSIFWIQGLIRAAGLRHLANSCHSFQLECTAATGAPARFQGSGSQWCATGSISMIFWFSSFMFLVCPYIMMISLGYV